MKYPQECLLRDRESAYYTMFNATSFEDAIRNELQNSIDVLKTVKITIASYQLNFLIFIFLYFRNPLKVLQILYQVLGDTGLFI